MSYVIERFIVGCWLTHKETEKPTICPQERLGWSLRPEKLNADGADHSLNLRTESQECGGWEGTAVPAQWSLKG